VGATGHCTMTPPSWSVCACIAKVLPRSSGDCSSVPLPQRYPCQPATNPAHARRADAWGSLDAASALPCLSPKLTSFATHVQGVRLNHAIFASEEVIFSRLGVKDGQKCPFKDSNVAAIMLTTPCGVSGDHPSLTLFAKILLQLVSPPLHVGWDTALFAGKYPMFT
jgi:hypothetical protein